VNLGNVMTYASISCDETAMWNCHLRLTGSSSYCPETGIHALFLPAACFCSICSLSCVHCMCVNMIVSWMHTSFNSLVYPWKTYSNCVIFACC
jgi:hypothetical protein